jgi:hypothetical protein
MQDANETSSAAKKISVAGSERTLRVAPSGAEIGYTLLALCSFSAALYALWLASRSAGLTLGAWASPQEVTDRYRFLIKQRHPDHGGDAEAAAKINAARETLETYYQSAPTQRDR